MYITIIMINMVFSSLFPQNSFEVIDDATQPKMSRWTVEGLTGPGIGADYVNSDKRRGSVIRFKGFGLNNVFTYKGDNGESLNIKNYKVLQWKMKYETPFIVQIKVSTNDGVKYLIYSDLVNRGSYHDTYMYTGIGPGYRDGRWKTVTRDLEKDLISFIPKVKLISIDSISFRGAGYIDDIFAFASTPGDLLLNKGTVKGWDKIGKGGRISVDNDATLGKVISFDSGAANADFRLRSANGSYWKIRTNTVLQWKIKTAQPYKVFVIGETLQGKYILSYASDDEPEYYDESSGIISYGLGKETIDGKWHAITRDIEQDIKKIAPQLDIASISTILIRGNGKITDVALLSKSPLESAPANGWDVFDNDPKGATVKSVNDIEKGDVVETSGEGILNGYKYSGKYGSIESDEKPFITWNMKFDEPFEIITLIQTDTVARYIHYVPKPAGYVEQKDGELYVGIGETTTDNRWHTMTRDLMADVKLISKGSKYVFCREVLVRGSGRIGKIDFSSENNEESSASSASAVASVVLGQFDFFHNLKNLWDVSAPSMNGLNNPSGLVVGPDNVMYVSDTDNNRLLIWNKIPKTSGVEADMIFYPDKLKRPTGLYITDKLLFIADTDNNRVIVFKLPVDELSEPILTINGLKLPRAVFYDGKKLFIADTGNNRVLVWNSLPVDGSTPFDVVLGQSSVSKVDSNRGREKPGFNTMSMPSSVYSDGKSVYVSDTGNNRVLIFNQIPTMDGWHADLVIGQDDFKSNDPNKGDKKPSTSTMNQPRFLTIDRGRLFVSDSKNNRVLVFENAVKENNAADGVIGQPGFKTAYINGPKNISGPGTLFLPDNIFIHDGIIFVADSFNNRILIY